MKTNQSGNKNQVRQGDVFAERIQRLPVGCRRVPLAARQYVIKRGEASGHAHVIDTEDIELWLDEEGQRFLKVINDTMARHEQEGSGTPTLEHDPVPYAVGIYHLPDQVEFDDDDIRLVAD